MRTSQPGPVEVRIDGGGVSLLGDLTVPDGATGIVAFAHGSGSSRLSRRNRAVAETFARAGIATLLFDLLTAEEERADRYTGHLRFDIPLLATRLAHATDWLRAQPQTAGLRIGYFGASTGAAAALIAASTQTHVAAVVSRGGRPDLAGFALPSVRAPTLLIVGAADTVVLDLNQRAFDRLRCEKRLEVIPGATHLFVEPGALEKVADLARAWFSAHFPGTHGPGAEKDPLRVGVEPDQRRGMAKRVPHRHDPGGS